MVVALFRYATGRRERLFWPLLLLGALVAMVISLFVGLHQSVWFDEAYSIMLAKRPIGELLHLTSLDTHPPFYYLLLKGWAGIFGWSELALRSLSVLAFGGSVILAGLVTRRMFGVRAALVSLPFVVFAPFLIRYGFEIRMYALASLIGIAATYVLIRALGATKRAQWLWFAGYSLLVALGVYTLYYMALLWMAHLAWVVWLTVREKKSLLRAPWVLAYIGSVVLFLPWLPTFLSQINNGALAPIAQAMTLENILGIVTFSFFYHPVWQLGAVMSLVAVFVCIALGVIISKAFRLVSRAQLPYLVLLALYVGVPVVILTLVSLYRPMYVERYISHVIVGGYVLVGVSVAIVISKSAPKKLWGMALLLLSVLLFGVVQVAQEGNYNFQRLQTPNVKQVASMLPPCREGMTVLAADPYVAIELSYYLPHCQIRFYSPWPTLAGGYAPLSGSPLQVKNPTKDLAREKQIIYVSYENSPLTLSPNFQETATRTYGAMTVTRFQSE